MADQDLDRPAKGEHGVKALWCPFAKICDTKMPTQGAYANGYPRGAIVHYSASQDGEGGIRYGAKMGYSYMVIDKMGVIYQATPLNRWGSHAGESSWPSLQGRVSQYLVGIEVDSYGKLELHNGVWTSWNGVNVPRTELRILEKDSDNAKAGTYQAYTGAQELALTKLLLWLKANNPDVFDLDLVLGHDEVAPGRKTDPGFSLSSTMPYYREYLKKTYAEEV